MNVLLNTALEPRQVGLIESVSRDIDLVPVQQARPAVLVAMRRPPGQRGPFPAAFLPNAPVADIAAPVPEYT